MSHGSAQERRLNRQELTEPTRVSPGKFASLRVLLRSCAGLSRDIEASGIGGSMSTTELSGKVALVTGSSRGIGRAIALALAGAGADVAVHFRISRAEAEKVASSIREAGQRALVLQGDVRRSDDVRAVVHAVLTEFGRVDILVNNAGYALGGPFLDLAEEAWMDQIDTLAGGYYRFIQATLPSMMAQQEGVILSIASTCGVRGSPGEVAYAAANGAIIALTRSLASELGSKGIRVNALLVAWASNAFDPNEPSHSAYLPQFPLGRITDVSEIAQAASYLCSNAASGITGAALPVDAGYLCC
jgi:3-oxoacyl-[acyl-carrier protein] reductase